jgi:hypothetical protein
MSYAVFVAGSFFVPLVVGLVIGSGTWRQSMLAASGLVFWLAFADWAKKECEADGEAFRCSLAAVSLAALAVVWLAGVGMAAFVRRDWRLGLRTATAVGVGLVLVGAALLVERYADEIDRLGCRSAVQPSPTRPQRVETVLEAFAEAGLPLEAIPLPAAIPPGSRGSAFRHVAPGASLYVFVCPDYCMAQRWRHDRDDTTGERWRLSWHSGNNVPIWLTETDEESGTRLIKELQGPLGEVHPRVQSRPGCWFRS